MTLAKPVLFLVFNRPDLTSQVWDAIRKARPPRLYIVADGPREDRDLESELCEQTRNVTERVDWPCEVSRRYRTKNLGCRGSLTDGIDWFFESEEDGIILEEDCLPSPDFFRFCAEMLDRYKENSEIMMISGDNFLPREKWRAGNHFFSIWIHVWGWASWRRAWKKRKTLHEGWIEYQETTAFRRQIGSAVGVRFWKKQLNQAISGTVDSWAFHWAYSVWSSGGLSILPGANLVKNIGFDERALHTRQKQTICLEWGDFSYPSKGPLKIRPNRSYERYLYRRRFNLRRNSFRSVIRRAFAK